MADIEVAETHQGLNHHLSGYATNNKRKSQKQHRNLVAETDLIAKFH